MTMPLALDLAFLPTALIGGGPALLKRLALLDSERIPGLTIYAPEPDDSLVAVAGGRLVQRLPTMDEVTALRVMFIAGLSFTQSAELAGIARDARVLVNVEDVLPFCDFHVPAILRRGDLAVAISSGGNSPTLSRRLKSYLARILPPEWAERTARIAAMRDKMRAQGATMREVMDATDALIEAESWLPPG